MDTRTRIMNRARYFAAGALFGALVALTAVFITSMVPRAYLLDCRLSPTKELTQMVCRETVRKGGER